MSINVEQYRLVEHISYKSMPRLRTQMPRRVLWLVCVTRLLAACASEPVQLCDTPKYFTTALQFYTFFDNRVFDKVSMLGGNTVSLCSQLCLNFVASDGGKCYFFNYESVGNMLGNHDCDLAVEIINAQNPEFQPYEHVLTEVCDWNVVRDAESK